MVTKVSIMIAIKLKLHKISPPENVILERHGEYDRLLVEEGFCLSDLTSTLNVPRMGFVILINGIAAHNLDMLLHDNDSVEIFKLHAGG